MSPKAVEENLRNENQLKIENLLLIRIQWEFNAYKLNFATGLILRGLIETHRLKLFVNKAPSSEKKKWRNPKKNQTSKDGNE